MIEERLKGKPLGLFSFSKQCVIFFVGMVNTRENSLGEQGVNNNPILSILQWMNKTRPNPSDTDRSTQLGVHFEEVTEMADALLLTEGMGDEFEAHLIAFISAGQAISQALKEQCSGIDFSNIDPQVRVDLLDSYCDQIVTVLGAGYTQHMDMLGAINEVDQSNWSKFDPEGNPIYDDNKKVTKGPNYRKAVLDPFV